ncbi:hypothetical protein BN7_435 [Wickerhamomyces ciferrii]|uniref:Uncharacterized protein n=1 Tax=Wickerhamomyces ciferrii (strain ATCC 14091 / BCRC 22168 / CBS 111 / JCM 3599 / NBRC 0793 / NRRL Y-1031 F-60-10) TaxID=1206466 RepID=K0KDC2_WICCF|nr:uncharacterized protein BN7_435 [Wickerhamomyces ciferrii]CCH40901.1 hypothetical protein BN7_435 [Wickerhamomyces ciferrii]
MVNELNPKVNKILDNDSKLKTHYEFLLNKKKIADKSLEEFLIKLEKDHEGIDLDDSQSKVDPSDINDYNKAIDYLNGKFFKQVDKVQEVAKYIESQQELEKVWEFTHKRYLKENKSEDQLNEFYKYIMKQLEDFNKKCHQKFYSLQIPLFCIKKEKFYPNLSKDRRKLIIYIQDYIESNQ